jgi:hypothetical protein
VILTKLPPDSVMVVQTEKSFDPALLPEAAGWGNRLYGRNRLSIWRSPITGAEAPPAESAEPS